MKELVFVFILFSIKKHLSSIFQLLKIEGFSSYEMNKLLF